MATYITSCGNIYQFLFEKQADNSLRIFVVFQPSYGSRDASSKATERLSDGRRWYILSLERLTYPYEAKTVAEEWAKRTDRYLYTGLPLSVPLSQTIHSRGGGTGPTPPMSVPVRSLGDDGHIRRGGSGRGGRGRLPDRFGIYARVPKIDWRSGQGGSDG